MPTTAELGSECRAWPMAHQPCPYQRGIMDKVVSDPEVESVVVWCCRRPRWARPSCCSIPSAFTSSRTALRAAGGLGGPARSRSRRAVPDRRGRRAEGPDRGRLSGPGAGGLDQLARRPRRHRGRGRACARRAGTGARRFCSAGLWPHARGARLRTRPARQSTPATRRQRSMPGPVGDGSMRRWRRSRAAAPETSRLPFRISARGR